MQRLLIGVSVVAVWLAGAICNSAFAEKPNIIVIMVDDFGFECVTANGGESYQTPHIDQLASTGMRFEHCHVQPLCTPTRVQLMTGIYNVRNYIEFGLLDPKATTFGHLLKKQGYATAIAGKWQLGLQADLPQHFGFDESCLWQLTRRPPRYANPGLEYNGVEKDFAKGEYGPALVNDFALSFIERHRSEPFFLYYPMILTHDPFQPTPDSPDWDPATTGEKAKRSVKNFAWMTQYMDKMVGRVVAKLEEFKLRENTLILFLGDNGTQVTVTSQFRGQPYQGGKGQGNAQGTHVPLIVNWPGHVPAGQENFDLIGSVDFLPTICEAAGVTVPAELAIDGISFLPQCLGKPSTPRQIHYCWYARDGGAEAKVEFAMTREMKLHRDGRLFDLTSDPLESQPLSSDQLTSAQREARIQLAAELERFREARPAHLAKRNRSEKSAKKKRQ
ncbi:MAG: sulfatase-like hydrolase/transferase [Planctomycetaceae bacterium]|nr:sulfatase-like hydrolase/transferase [Planctomycetaceae bacterium]